MKIKSIINRRVDREDYDQFINPIHQKMRDENDNKKPTFKECISAIKRLYRLEMNKSLPKHYEFKTTSGNRHTWCRSRNIILIHLEWKKDLLNMLINISGIWVL